MPEYNMLQIKIISHIRVDIEVLETLWEIKLSSKLAKQSLRPETIIGKSTFLKVNFDLNSELLRLLAEIITLKYLFIDKDGERLIDESLLIPSTTFIKLGQFNSFMELANSETFKDISSFSECVKAFFYKATFSEATEKINYREDECFSNTIDISKITAYDFINSPFGFLVLTPKVISRFAERTNSENPYNSLKKIVQSQKLFKVNASNKQKMERLKKYGSSAEVVSIENTNINLLIPSKPITDKYYTYFYPTITMFYSNHERTLDREIIMSIQTELSEKPIIKVFIKDSTITASIVDGKLSATVDVGNEFHDLGFIVAGYMAINLLQAQITAQKLVTTRLSIVADELILNAFRIPDIIINEAKGIANEKLAAMAHLLIYKTRIFANINDLYDYTTETEHKREYSGLLLRDVDFDQFCRIRVNTSKNLFIITPHSFQRFTERVLPECLTGKFKNPFKYFSYLIKHADWKFIKCDAALNSHYYDQDSNGLVILSKLKKNEFKIVTYWRGSEYSDVEMKLNHPEQFVPIKELIATMPLNIIKELN